MTSDFQKKTYVIKEGYTVAVKKGEKLIKGGVFAVKGRSKLKVKEDGEILDVAKDHIIL